MKSQGVECVYWQAVFGDDCKTAEVDDGSRRPDAADRYIATTRTRYPLLQNASWALRRRRRRWRLHLSNPRFWSLALVVGAAFGKLLREVGSGKARGGAYYNQSRASRTTHWRLKRFGSDRRKLRFASSCAPRAPCSTRASRAPGALYSFHLDESLSDLANPFWKLAKTPSSRFGSLWFVPVRWILFRDKRMET